MEGSFNQLSVVDVLDVVVGTVFEVVVGTVLGVVVGDVLGVSVEAVLRDRCRGCLSRFL